MPTVNEYAELVLNLIRDDVRDDQVSERVVDFSQLHDYVDANMYLIHVGQDYDGSDASRAEITAIQDRVSARLQEGALLENTRSGLIDMRAVTAELVKLGVHAECGNSGGNVQTIYAGTLDVNEYDEARYAVIAGPGTLCTVSGKPATVGYTVEWVFCMDSDERQASGARDDVYETPAQLAARIAEMVRLVQAKRDERQVLLAKLADGETSDAVTGALDAFWSHVTDKVFPGVHRGDNDTATEEKLSVAAHAAMRAWLLRNFDLTVTPPRQGRKWLVPVQPDSGQVWTLMHTRGGRSMPQLDLFTDPQRAIAELAARVRSDWGNHGWDLKQQTPPVDDHEAIAVFFAGGKRGTWELNRSTVDTAAGPVRAAEHVLINAWQEAFCICGNEASYAGFGYVASDGSDNGAEQGPCTHLHCYGCGRVFDARTGQVLTTV